MNWYGLIRVAEVLLATVFVLGGLTARQEQLAHFIKNVALLGGLAAMIVAVG